MRIILLGAPGSGKGTQSATLTNKLNIPAISTGDMLRAEIKNGTPIGHEAEVYINEGKLVPDRIILDMVEARLEKPDCARGYILDGFPRNKAQAESLEQDGVKIDAVLLFMNITDEAIVERMSGRRVCRCGRTYHNVANPPKKDGVCDDCGEELFIRRDDEPETVRNRLKVYHAETSPLLEFYESRGLLRQVKCCGKVDDTTANTLKAIEDLE